MPFLSLSIPLFNHSCLSFDLISIFNSIFISFFPTLYPFLVLFITIFPPVILFYSFLSYFSSQSYPGMTASILWILFLFSTVKYFVFLSLSIPFFPSVILFIPSQSELFRIIQISVSDSMRTNPKKVFNLVCWKTLENESESTRTRIDLNRIFNLNESESIRTLIYSG